jgi:ABC-type polysaccharide/polyol phosphate transport system ATPase subunit
MEDTQKPCTLCGNPADTVPIFVGHATQAIYRPMCDACIYVNRGGTSRIKKTR